jgi:lysyl-tRNA synthetase class 2
MLAREIKDMFSKDSSSVARGKQLLSDPNTLSLFKKKFALIHAIRDYLYSCGAIEVEVAYMNKYREGAPLHQYETTDPVTKERFFLRHSPENFLRRVVQPFRHIYEIGKNFRVETEDAFRANEYIVLEHKSVEHTYRAGIDMMANMVKYAVNEAFGSLNTGVVDFSKLSIVTFDDMMKRHMGFSMYDPDYKTKALIALAPYELPISSEKYDWEVFELILKYFIEANINDPTIVIDYPIALQHISVADYDRVISERFTMVINTVEVCDGGVKFDNAKEYEVVFEENADYAKRYMDISDFEVSPEFYEDVDFTHEKMFGYGLGIDRLFAVCVGKNIHDIILFPHR